MKVTLIFSFFILITITSIAQPAATQSYSASAANMKTREKFQDEKFGMFIHWGVYSILADGEWVMNVRKIPYSSYSRLPSFFNPQGFNAKEWVQIAKNAGMKYITITSRHHDGFSMFKTAASPYNIVDATPYHKDPILELAAECQRQGMDIHFYYSLLDWGRSDYGYTKPIVNGRPVDTEWESYINFMKTQLTELIKNYPNVTAIWFDGHWERPNVNWHYNEIYALIHQLNPAIMIGNNHHLAPFAGEDFQMFEKDLPGENSTGFSGQSKVSNLPLETCETINNSWGFNLNDRRYKTVKQIVHYLVNAAGRNANFLLNVGPMPDGKIQSEFTDTLAAVGKWMAIYGESIYGTRGNVVAPQSWGVITAKDKKLYVHLLNRTTAPYIFVQGLTQQVTAATLFAGKKQLTYKQQPEGLFIYLNDIVQDEMDMVIELTIQ